jgi:Zn-dependent protease with chaperone function
MKNCFNFRMCLALVLSSFSSAVLAQPDLDHYKPRASYSGNSRALITSLTQNLLGELAGLDESDNARIVSKLNDARVQALANMVTKGAFLQDDSLETYVNTTLENIVRANAIAPDYRRVLILDSPQINAFCFGHGIYIVTVGLLGRIHNENELAFTLAHEVAHDLLGHIRKRIVREAEVSMAKKTKEQVRKMLSGTIEPKDIEEYRSLVYGVTRHTRINELQADSMGMSLMQNAGYDGAEGIGMLTVLDESLKPKFDIGADLVWPLHAKEYPLQESWFSKRLSIYSRGYTDSYLYSVDSLETHPDIALRRKMIEQYRRNDVALTEHQPESFVYAVTVMAEFETLQSACEHAAYDRGLFYALQLLDRYPANPFLVTRIGKMLTTLYQAKSNNDNTFTSYVPKYTAYYSEELTLINNMLHNLSAKELGEVAYYFINNPEHFNAGEKSHYFLLWKISNLTYRRDVADSMKDAFRDKFHGAIGGYELK